MRNKSRKRILHEQRVEIEGLRRRLRLRSFMQNPLTYGTRECDIVTLRRDFIVPFNVVGAETIRDYEAYKTMKGIMQQIVNLLEIRCEDMPECQSEKYTVILRAVRPLSSQVDPEAFTKTAQGGNLCDDLLNKPKTLVEWYPADNEILYGGIRDGGRKFYETHVLGKFKAKDGE